MLQRTRSLIRPNWTADPAVLERTAVAGRNGCEDNLSVGRVTAGGHPVPDGSFLAFAMSRAVRPQDRGQNCAPSTIIFRLPRGARPLIEEGRRSRRARETPSFGRSLVVFSRRRMASMRRSLRRADQSEFRPKRRWVAQGLNDDWAGVIVV